MKLMNVMLTKVVVMRLALCLLVPLVFVTSASADWGDLTGTIVIDKAAKVPAPAPIVVNKDVDVCGKHNLKDESFRVNPDNRGLADVLVYVYAAKGPKPKVHESYGKTASSEVTIDNLNCRYEPRVVLLRTTQTLVIGNKDPVGHNTKIDTFANPAINPIIPAGASLKQKFSLAEKRPSAVGCNIHPWMNAWLLVQDHPYMAVTDADGKFTIKNLPSGKWTFQFRHPDGGYVREVMVNNKKEKWSKGRTEVEIKSGTNDLGELVIPAAAAAKMMK